jgi:putative glutamine amidotransferase
VAAPAIGICAAIETVRWGPWEETVALAPRSYGHAVQRAGGLALLIPPDERAIDDLDQLLDRIDALMLAGGSDIDPAIYGEARHPQTGLIWRERDLFEVAILRRALEREMPVLAICRGMQMLNVARGGTLEQHVPERVGNEDHRKVAGTYGRHDVRLEPGSLAARSAGSEALSVFSHHHQGVGELGDGVVESGWSHGDDLVEAIELPGDSFALGVLWHPEEDADSPLISSLVEEAGKKAGVG